jgi:hypothetical protein
MSDSNIKILCGWWGKFLIVLLLYSGHVLLPVQAQSDSSPVAGWVEKARLPVPGLLLQAKLDTGAQTTSINAVDLQYFELEGQSWVRFSLKDFNDTSAILERPVVRVSTIKRHFDKQQKRPVIHLEICVGPVKKEVEVNLVDRTGLNYQLLIGRNFLANGLLINSARTYQLSPDC